MAARLRERGYHASNYLETGITGDVTWSLQAVLPGRVPSMLTVGHAEQLVALACRHAIDSGESRPWDELAREVVMASPRRGGAAARPVRGDPRGHAHGDSGPLPRADDHVHHDFHHRNFLVEDGRVTGVFDWDIATPGDWRFDLVSFAWVCQMYPKSCEPDALATVVTAVHEHCDAPTAAFLMACQVLRSLSQLRRGQPARVGSASRRDAGDAPPVVDLEAAANGSSRRGSVGGVVWFARDLSEACPPGGRGHGSTVGDVVPRRSWPALMTAARDLAAPYGRWDGCDERGTATAI